MGSGAASRRTGIVNEAESIVPSSLTFEEHLKSQRAAKVTPFYKYHFALNKGVAFTSEGVMRVLRYTISPEAESDFF